MKNEVADAGFEIKSILAVEGISYMLKDFDRNWDTNKDMVLDIVRKTEAKPTLIGASPHIMCVTEKR